MDFIEEVRYWVEKAREVIPEFKVWDFSSDLS